MILPITIINITTATASSNPLMIYDILQPISAQKFVHNH